MSRAKEKQWVFRTLTPLSYAFPTVLSTSSKFLNFRSLLSAQGKAAPSGNCCQELQQNPRCLLVQLLLFSLCASLWQPNCTPSLASRGQGSCTGSSSHAATLVLRVGEWKFGCGQLTCHGAVLGTLFTTTINVPAGH